MLCIDILIVYLKFLCKYNKLILQLYSNYVQIQTLAHQQHEMATQTISMQQGLEDKGYEEWVGEMIGMREILRIFANISSNDVVGMRAPYLKPGRNTQYKVYIIINNIYISLYIFTYL